MTDVDQQRLFSALDDVRNALHELLLSAQLTFGIDGAEVQAECLPGILLRELDRVCDGLLAR